MSETRWTPSPQLSIAVSKALAALARHWPRALALALESSEAGRGYNADYARAMLGCDLDAIPEAAQRWLSENATPPRPAELAKLAREITRDRRPPSYGAFPASATVVPAITGGKDLTHIDRLGGLAFHVLGSWTLVGHVWDLLWESAPHEDQRDAARNGQVPTDVFEDAVAAVKRGRRAHAGRLPVPLPTTAA